MTDHPFSPYRPQSITHAEGARNGEAFEALMDTRRSVRFFSDRPVPRSMIETAIRTASTAPSGAHMQPWTFVAVSDPAVKKQIREAAEREEKRSYESRMSDEWRDALRPLGTGWQKPYLEIVPWIVIAFAQNHSFFDDGTRKKHYYVRESVGLACGLFIASLHQMGLATLTHTPAPMTFLSEICGRPKNEKPYILFPIGYPTEDCVVPDLQRKTLEEVSAWFEPDVQQ